MAEAVKQNGNLPCNNRHDRSREAEWKSAWQSRHGRSRVCAAAEGGPHVEGRSRQPPIMEFHAGGRLAVPGHEAAEPELNFGVFDF